MNFVSTGLTFKVNDKYSIFGHYAYNILDDSTRSWSLGYDMKKRCWNYKVYYKEEYRPVLTNIGVTYGGDKFSTFDNATHAPVQTDIALQFKEMELLNRQMLEQEQGGADQFTDLRDSAFTSGAGYE